jgi:hypothetical protein
MSAKNGHVTIPKRRKIIIEPTIVMSWAWVAELDRRHPLCAKPSNKHRVNPY